MKGQLMKRYMHIATPPVNTYVNFESDIFNGAYIKINFVWLRFVGMPSHIDFWYTPVLNMRH